ncbi:ATP synthase F0 subcomplex A subunit [Anaerobacterium chartisolvens]|uniref:ATP synthase subunit a n=1 Tax=Anaerobacterium chartisolvens TaxID=1297424 RepID=A0A369AY25_9FIRM|nr:F0F1 ATP synthase subunit A [Anaerobacterium chartisolvens]RCX14322.1 ATP synthase F0 subcomplex A subunit [Anaerobacterium chartisolvens]
MELGERLTYAMQSHELFGIRIFGYRIPVSDTMVVVSIIVTALILLAFIFTRKLEAVPKGKQNVVEAVVEFINSFAKENIGHHWRFFSAYLGTVLLFLIVSNTISIFNIFPGHDFKLRPPTRNINVTACMAIISILVVLFSGIAIKKPKGWLKSFAEPMPVILPFKILDYFIRPFSLALRLFGNIMGAFIIMELIYLVMPAVVPAALSIYFDLFDGILQAYIFVFLSSLYIAEAIE